MTKVTSVVPHQIMLNAFFHNDMLKGILELKTMQQRQRNMRYETSITYSLAQFHASSRSSRVMNHHKQLTAVIFAAIPCLFQAALNMFTKRKQINEAKSCLSLPLKFLTGKSNTQTAHGPYGLRVVYRTFFVCTALLILRIWSASREHTYEGTGRTGAGMHACKAASRSNGSSGGVRQGRRLKLRRDATNGTSFAP